jgi:galactoside O-acetyltransferase
MMFIFRLMIRVLNRLSNNRLARYKYRKNLKIDRSARLQQKFSVSFLVSPVDRHYVEIGARCFLNAQIIFESKDGVVKMGDRVYIGGCLIICRNMVTIGDDVTIAWGVTIYDHNSNSLDWRQRAKVTNHFYETYGTASCYEELDWTGVASAPIVIEDKVWIGMDVVLLKGVRIGEGAVVGARSVVTHDVEPYTVVAGNPAVVVKRIDR